MIGTALLTYFQHCWRQPAGRTLPVAPVAASPFTLAVTALDGQTAQTMLIARGVLKRRAGDALLTAAQALHAQGCRHLLVDLHDVTHLDLAGRFALHNVKRLYRGQPVLDPEDGWWALHTATTDESTAADAPVQVLTPPTLVTTL